MVYTYMWIHNWPDFDHMQLTPDLKAYAKGERVLRLREYCSKIPKDQIINEEKKLLHGNRINLLAVDKYKLLFCEIPKSGASSWKYLLMKLSSNSTEINGGAHDPEVLNSHNITFMKEGDTIWDVDEKYKDYYKVISVRHPLDRIISAYRDKMLDHPERPMSRSPIQTMLKRRKSANIKIHDPRFAKIPTWEEFVWFVTHKPGRDPHWMKYYDLCHPCVIEYDFVAKMETLESDVKQVLDQIGAPPITIGHSNESKGKILNKTSTDYLKDINTTGSLEVLWNHFSQDADIFGYTFSHESLETICETKDSEGRCC